MTTFSARLAPSMWLYTMTARIPWWLKDVVYFDNNLNLRLIVGNPNAHLRDTEIINVGDWVVFDRAANRFSRIPKSAYTVGVDLARDAVSSDTTFINLYMHQLRRSFVK